jgi:dolichol-phosphate mannosyltransferase
MNAATLPPMRDARDVKAVEDPRAKAHPEQKLALVIPTLYEAGNIRPLLERARSTLDALGIPYELIVVDDDSRDGIEAIVSEITREDRRVRLLTRVGQRGLAGAVIYGWANTDAGIVGVMDADLQHPPELLAQLWNGLGTGVDIVVASRYAPQGSRPNWNRLRHLLSQMAIWMTLPLQRSGVRVSDPMSGFFLVRRSAIQNLALQQQGFKILLEILVCGDIRSAVEIPFTFGNRQAGRSKASLRVGLEYLLLLARLWRRKKRLTTNGTKVHKG